MSNKKDNKLDFRNVKNSQFDGSQTQKMAFSELQSAYRQYDTNAILKDAYTHFVQTLDVNDRPTKVEYYQATDPTQDRITVRADVGGDLAGTYMILQESISKKSYVFWFKVSGVGTAPGIGDVEIQVDLNNNDPAALVAFTLKSVISNTTEFVVINDEIISNKVDVEYFQFGETDPLDVGTTGFLVTRLKEGSSFLVGEVELTYDLDGSPVYNGNKLKGLLYNPYTASFDVERDEITVTSVVSLDPIISKDPSVYNVSMPVAGTEYSLALPLDTKRFQMNIRDSKSTYTVSWVSAGAYLSKGYGVVYEENNLQIIAGKETLYFTAPKANMVMEIVTWK
jgi:hypothetical protein